MNDNLYLLRINRLTSAGVVIFITAFIVATFFYPGGNQVDASKHGFDWMHNYWCNLMNESAINGEMSMARWIAIPAWLILCLSLAFFFYQIAELRSTTLRSKQILKFGGIFTALASSLLFTRFHDEVTILASIIGLLLILIFIRIVYHLDTKLYQVGGLVCLILLAVNNFIYYTEILLSYLPIIQKATFAFILSWILGYNASLYRSIKSL